MKFIFLILSIYFCLFGCSSSKQKKSSEVSLVFNKKIETNFQFQNIKFYPSIIDTSRVEKNIFTTPEGFHRMISKKEIQWNLNFQKKYFSFTDSIPNIILNSDSFYHLILSFYLINIENNDNDFQSSLSRKKFSISKKIIKNYGECMIATISTEWNNSNQNYCTIIVNNGKLQLSIWDFDNIMFDNNGNVVSLFRLKNNRTWICYKYDTFSNYFFPVGYKSIQLK